MKQDLTNFQMDSSLDEIKEERGNNKQRKMLLIYLVLSSWTRWFL